MSRYEMKERANKSRHTQHSVPKHKYCTYNTAGKEVLSSKAYSSNILNTNLSICDYLRSSVVDYLVMPYFIASLFLPPCCFFKSSFFSFQVQDLIA